jgi:predicted Zn-ribbon and HTH transcriptional regulator
MKTGTCPKCRSTEVYRGVKAPLEAGDGLLHVSAIHNNTGLNILLEPYVCRACGYVEMFVAEDSRNRLQAVALDTKRWQKVA